ncbi:MAG: hypothetical protein ACRDD1_00770, partial [Planctomycetia bacterium]
MNRNRIALFAATAGTMIGWPLSSTAGTPPPTSAPRASIRTYLFGRKPKRLDAVPSGPMTSENATPTFVPVQSVQPAASVLGVVRSAAVVEPPDAVVSTSIDLAAPLRLPELIALTVERNPRLAQVAWAVEA